MAKTAASALSPNSHLAIFIGVPSSSGPSSLRSTDALVPVLSLGATRRFLLKPRQGGRSIALSPASGDLVVMGGRCQRDWRHCVPKQTTPTGARVSVNFSSRLQAVKESGKSAR
ncbi:alpha-ketoglutarate-dependent dioxygenase AlkB [Longispora albida]|uniref:alpha-ketoglutarate-dependent dioxygenase AlkB n=1 Tax=Longispora albida TaxID=203523 RepID=UPI003CCBEA5F